MPLTRRRLYWCLQLMCWTLYALVGLAIFYAVGQVTPGLAASQVVICGLHIAATHLLRHCIQRGGWLHLPVVRVIPRLLVLNAALAVVVQGLISLLMIFAVHLFTYAQFKWSYLLVYSFQANFVFWLWSGFYFGLHYLDQYKQADVDKWRLAAAVREAEMRTLKAQINPHFLFNGLNNIRALVLENPARAREMMTHLSDLLRYSLQQNSRELVPLARELETVRHYLALEALQLEERLTYSLDVDPAALDVPLPPMTLQLLVENAIKHGIAPRPGGGQVQLSAQLDGAGHLLVRVRNPGCYRPAARPGPDHTGVGLPNAQERLQLLFGPAATLRIGPDARQADTVTAELRLPVLAVGEVGNLRRLRSPFPHSLLPTFPLSP